MLYQVNLGIFLLLLLRSGVYMNSTDLIFLGPGWGSYGHSEVFSLSNMQPYECSIPLHPEGHIYATVGVLTPDGKPLICGGFDYDRKQTFKTCYSLEEKWVLESKLTVPRAASASALLRGNMWVT